MLKHGEWLPWLKKYCEFDERTAQKYTQLVGESNASLGTDLPLRSKRQVEADRRATRDQEEPPAPEYDPMQHLGARDESHEESAFKQYLADLTLRDSISERGAIR